VTFATLLLAFVTLERLGELWLARLNTRALLARGAFEAGAGHYPAIVLLHGAWLATLWVVGWNAPVDAGWLTVFAAFQVLRFWVLASLGGRWTTRIIVLPGAPLVTRGPYRFLAHPNYVVVVGEIAVLPLTLGQPVVAVLFSLANAVLLAIRIRCESTALRAAAPSPDGRAAPRVSGNAAGDG
jgi:Uncharacterized protein conserved in bacteria